MQISLGAVFAWLLSMGSLFLVIYGAVRLALHHDRSRVADRELRARVATERAEQKREFEIREARRRRVEGSDDA